MLTSLGTRDRRDPTICSGIDGQFITLGLAVLIANDTEAHRAIRSHLAGNRMSLPLFDRAANAMNRAWATHRNAQEWPVNKALFRP